MNKNIDKTASIGTVTRRKVLGDKHVNKANDNTTSFDESFQEYITCGAWGKVWSRTHLTLREKSLLTIALLAALGHEEELAMHVRATLNTGATEKDVSETLLHVAVYAGVPYANRSIKIAKEVFEEIKSGKPK